MQDGKLERQDAFGTVETPLGWVEESSKAALAQREALGQKDCPVMSDGLSLDFRKAMRRLAATVSIITTRHDGLCHGMTATAISSLTVDPPALLVCINRTASIHEHLQRSRHFCVNLLGVEHGELCAAFSGKLKGQERFTIGEWRTDDVLMPYLETAQANIFCKLDADIGYGTHTIFIGRVEQVQLQENVKALVYQDGNLGHFRALAASG